MLTFFRNFSGGLQKTPLANLFTITPRIYFNYKELIAEVQKEHLDSLKTLRSETYDSIEKNAGDFIIDAIEKNLKIEVRANGQRLVKQSDFLRNQQKIFCSALNISSQIMEAAFNSYFASRNVGTCEATGKDHRDAHSVQTYILWFNGRLPRFFHTLKNKVESLTPVTLEGQVVRFAQLPSKTLEG